MLHYSDYKNRVTRLEDGTYCWRSPVDKSVTGFAYKLTFAVCGGICAMFILMSLFMDPYTRKITFLICLAVMAVTAGIVLIFKKLEAWDEFYWMNEEYIKIGTGRSTRIMEYDKLQRVILNAKTIRLEKKMGKETVFIPDGDYDIVKNHILRRISGMTEVTREGPWEDN